MVDATTRIKNLSIALERLSRKNRNVSISDRVYALLSHEITKAEEENQRPQAARSADSTPYDMSIQP